MKKKEREIILHASRITQNLLMCCSVVRATLCGDAKLYLVFVLRFKLFKKLYNLADSMLNYNIKTGLYRTMSLFYFNLYLFKFFMF